MLIKYSALFTFCTTWSIVGFPFLAAFTSSIGVLSTEFSIAVRTLAAASAAILLLKWNVRINQLAIVVFTIFWIAYFFRLYLATFLDLEDLSRPEQLYWIWALGACFLPALAVLVHANKANFDKIYYWLLSLSIISVVLAVVNGNTLTQGIGGDFYDSHRLSLRSLNPIALGHLGITCTLLGVCGFFSRNFTSRFRWIAAFAILIGLVAAVLANSRGPFVAFIICILILIGGGARRKRTYVFVGVFIGAAFFAYNVFYASLFSTTGVFVRFSGVASGDAAVAGRVLAYQGAINQFLDSPIFGDAVEERLTSFYPHNVVLETFMATGVVGGIPFLTFVVLSLLRSWRLIQTGSKNLWIGVLATQYFVGAMFSGALYSSNTMWVLLSLTFCSPIRKKSENENK